MHLFYLPMHFFKCISFTLIWFARTSINKLTWCLIGFWCGLMWFCMFASISKAILSTQNYLHWSVFLLVCCFAIWLSVFCVCQHLNHYLLWLKDLNFNTVVIQWQPNRNKDNMKTCSTSVYYKVCTLGNNYCQTIRMIHRFETTL